MTRSLELWRALPCIAVLALVGSAWAQETRSSEPVGIIVLGGGLTEFVRVRSVGEAPWGPAERVAAGIEAWRAHPRAKLVYTGDEGSLDARTVLEAEGVPPEAIVVEKRSRNTAENARFTAQLLEPKTGQTWLLVTSKVHMPRALACFRSAGFEVEPVSVDNGTPPISREVREWIGRAGYALAGSCTRP
jgi:uncharacterized SAM-binding protein YcdF (DUF218 family)